MGYQAQGLLDYSANGLMDMDYQTYHATVLTYYRTFWANGLLD